MAINKKKITAKKISQLKQKVNQSISENENKLDIAQDLYVASKISRGTYEQCYQFGKNLLHNATWFGGIEYIKNLVKNRPEFINQQDNYGYTPLMSCVRSLNESALKLEICKLLIDNGADISITDNDGKTVLHEAIFSGEVEIAEYLLNLFIARGLPLTLQTNEGYSFMHEAIFACKHNRELIELLREYNVPENVRDNGGRTPKDVVQERYNHSAFRIASESDTDVVKKLLEKGAEVVETPLSDVIEEPEDELGDPNNN